VRKFHSASITYITDPFSITTYFSSSC